MSFRFWLQEISPVARERLRLLRFWHALGQKGTNSFEAAELLGLARPTLYRWRKRLEAESPRGLDPRGRRGGFRFKRPGAIRWPRGLKRKEPEDLAELDTLSVTVSGKGTGHTLSEVSWTRREH